MNKKAQIQVLVSIAWVLVTFGIIISVGMMVLSKMGDQVVTCSDGIVSASQTNETGWLNSTGYTLAQSTKHYGFASPVIVAIINATSNKTIDPANYTLTGNILYNTTSIVWNPTNITYTYTWDNTHTWNSTSQTCVNASNTDPQTGVGTSYVSLAYISTQLGSTGLASYIPLIIIVMVAGVIFLYFGMGRKSY